MADAIRKLPLIGFSDIGETIMTDAVMRNRAFSGQWALDKRMKPILLPVDELTNDALAFEVIKEFEESEERWSTN